jgi:DNA-binding CsgD family transcriptional regulator
MYYLLLIAVLVIVILFINILLSYWYKILVEKRYLEKMLSIETAKNNEIEKKFTITLNKLREIHNSRSDIIPDNTCTKEKPKEYLFSKTEYLRWEDFRSDFILRHPFFFDKLRKKHLDLTLIDLRYCACFYCQYTNQQTSILLSVSQDAVKKSKQRLKRKFGLNCIQELSCYLLNLDHETI